MQDIKLIGWQVAAGGGALVLWCLITAIPAVGALLPDWDSGIIGATLLTVLCVIVMCLLAVMAQSWIVYAILAFVWALGLMILNALLLSVLHAPALDKAGPAGMVAIMPVIVFFFAMPAGLVIRWVWQALRG